MSIIVAAKVNAASFHYSNAATRSSQARVNRPAASRSQKYNVPMARNETRMHRLIKDQGIVLVPGCYDALSATIVQKTGFSAGFISGYSLSASLLAKPDLGFLTTPEIVEVARYVCEAAPLLPIMVDADNGGGNVLNVERTIKGLIAAGAAGCFLEDQAWPRKCGPMLGKKVIPVEEHAAKIALARDAIGDADFFLVARTEARATSAEYGLSEAISRSNLYLEAGADACFVGAPRSDDELREIGEKVNGLKVCTMLEGGVTPLHTPQELKAMGFHLMIHPLTTMFASTRAMVDILKNLKETGSTKDDLNKLSDFVEFNQLVSLETWFELEEKFSAFK